jgi:hypothetical protein
MASDMNTKGPYHVVTVGKKVGAFCGWFVHLSNLNYLFLLMASRTNVALLVMCVSGAMHAKHPTCAEKEAVFTDALNKNNVRVVE